MRGNSNRNLNVELIETKKAPLKELPTKIYDRSYRILPVTPLGNAVIIVIAKKPAIYWLGRKFYHD